MKPWHKDDFYLEYDDLVEAGEIDSSEITIDEFVEDRFTDMIERAQDMIDINR